MVGCGHITLPMKTCITLFTLTLLAGGLQLAAATIPYTNDFSGTGANTAFTTETTDAEWALNGGAYRHNYANHTITPSSASLSITGVAGTDFVLETQFTVQQTGSINGNGATLGMGLFSLSSTFAGSNSSTSYYLADLVYGHSSGSEVGRLRIVALGDTTGYTNANGLADDNASGTLAITTGTTYTMRLEGTYAENGSLSMTLGLFNAAGNAQIGTSATATDLTPLTGTNFGYRNRIGIGSGSSIIDFDNFSVTPSAIPEPSAFALLGGLAALGMTAVKRRRRA